MLGKTAESSRLARSRRLCLPLEQGSFFSTITSSVTSCASTLSLHLVSMSLVAAASAHLESRYTLVLLTYLGTCAVLVVTNVVRALSFGGGADAATRAKWLVLTAASLGATWY